MADTPDRIKGLIQTRLQDALSPVHLEVENESYMHRVPENSETHFRVLVVSEAFAGKRQVACHQMIYGLLGDLLGNPVHAVALHTYGPKDWTREMQIRESPQCAHKE